MSRKAMALVQCRECGELFFSRAKKLYIARRRKYCDQCLRARHAANQANATKASLRTCDICGERFAGATAAKYCSDDCRRESNNRRNRAFRRRSAPKEFFCEHCGARFDGEARSRYCSERCRNAHHNEKRRSGKIDPKYLRRWGPDGPTYLGKGTCFDGAKL